MFLFYIQSDYATIFEATTTNKQKCNKRRTSRLYNIHILCGPINSNWLFVYSDLKSNTSIQSIHQSVPSNGRRAAATKHNQPKTIKHAMHSKTHIVFAWFLIFRSSSVSHSIEMGGLHFLLIVGFDKYWLWGKCHTNFGRLGPIIEWPSNTPK